MTTIELSALAIVVLYVAVRLRREPRATAARLALLAIGAFIAEDSVIHAYGFYGYDSPAWSVLIDRVPLLVVLIWPVVIHSAWDLARHLCRTHPSRVPLAGFGLVLADAWLIEPVAVQAGLWAWTEPGLFAVPPIGVLGWAFFAGVCMAVLQRVRTLPALGLLIVAAAPALTHALLLASWWGALRWVNGTVPAAAALALAWTLSCGLAAWALATRAALRVPLPDMLVRVPAAAFFFVLLALYGRDSAPLVAWALAFAPPYLALVNWRPQTTPAVVTPRTG